MHPRSKSVARKLLDKLRPVDGTIYHPSIGTISSLLYCPGMEITVFCPRLCPINCFDLLPSGPCFGKDTDSCLDVKGIAPSDSKPECFRKTCDTHVC